MRKPKFRKKTILIFLISILLAFLLWFGFKKGLEYIRLYLACADVEINHYKYPILGIDISSYQKDIDWSKVYDANVKFAFIKATEGETFVDKKFKENIQNARKNSIFTGAYHFYRFSKLGKTQALNFINTVNKDSIDFPPVVDIEDYGFVLTSFNHNRIVSEIFICLRELEKYYGVKPIIYTNISTYKKYIEGNFEEYDLWISRLCKEPEDENWIFWQYSHSGTLQGIDHDVDLNTFNGGYEEFDKYIRKLKPIKNIENEDINN